MHPLHDYLAGQLADRLRQRQIVVWYDKRSEYAPFVDELRGGPRQGREPRKLSIAGVDAQLVEYAGSMFELRAVVESLVACDMPAPLVMYLPGCAHDAKTSVLMELELAGTVWSTHLKDLARIQLLKTYTLGVVDELVAADRNVTYQDLARAAAGGEGTEPPSILKGIFQDTSGHDGLLAAWLVSDARDPAIVEKAAGLELRKLVQARLGFALPADASLAKQRAMTVRYVLVGEFRSDLTCPAPAVLDGVPVPGTKELGAVRELAHRVRLGFPEAYAGMADVVEQDLRLRDVSLPAGALGAIDTFRFEERSLLGHAGELIVAGAFDEALRLVGERERSFWLDRDVGRRAQWELTRRIAELGREAALVRSAVAKAGRDAAAWVAAYAGDGGWYRLDQAQRRLETWLNSVDEDVPERPLALVRRAYEDACHAMAVGFAQALGRAGWTVAGQLHQTRVYSEIVAAQPRPVAYFLVDAMRFEMGMELKERLPATTEVAIRAAVCALPSITPVGMAALLPGASSSFAVVEQGGKLGAQIDDAFLAGRADRTRFAQARVPHLVDLPLEDLLILSPAKLGKKLDGAQIVIVRSQAIDQVGEGGGDLTCAARLVMDTVIDNIGRALKKLAAAGIEHAVVSADHGHLFFDNDRDESMRIDAPGGRTVELHRRCWIGRGGQTPAGCVRVSAAELGYASDLELVFPIGAGVFRAGGDLAFHHGGPSLQELVIPVLTIRTKARTEARRPSRTLEIAGVPETITNRIFSVKLTLGGRQMTLGEVATQVRPLLQSAGRQVGAVAMVVGNAFDRATGTVMLQPGTPVEIAFMLSDDTVEAVRIVVLDPATDVQLYASPADLPVRVLS